MPVFHTKTIESILEPVAQQVSRLVILHEEAEDGSAMPDLSVPVGAVSRAVDNLIKVGYDTIGGSNDQILRQDMPPALKRVEASSGLLEEACAVLRAEPHSVLGRTKLIDGARGILQGTSALLLCFDESEVRKIIRSCKKVMDYLAVAEVIETMEDLLQFVKDISPWLTRVSRDMDEREKELTHRVHREILVRCMDTVKTLSPILVCSMKIFAQIHSSGGKGVQEAAENRNYLASRMTDNLHEIIRVLQLTTYDEDEWDADNLTVMKKAMNAIDSLLQAALDWLADPRALRGGIGEKSIRRILEYAERIAHRALPEDAALIRRCNSEIASMTDSLAELRHKGQGDTAQGQGLARGIAEKLMDLVGTKERMGQLQQAILNMERSGILQTAHTVMGQIEQALRWLDNLGIDDRGLGLSAIRLVCAEGRKVALQCPGPDGTRLGRLCAEVEGLAGQLADLQRRGLGESPEAKAIAARMREKLGALKDLMMKLILERVVEDFADINIPLRQFVEAATAPEHAPNREPIFHDKARNLKDHSDRCASTGRLVAAGGAGKDKRVVEALVAASNQVESLAPQVINAGKIRLHYPNDPQADQHFGNIRKEFADALARLRALVDDAIDTGDFIGAIEEAMHRYTAECEAAIRGQEPQALVDSASANARLANRALMAGRGEADNSEDPAFVDLISRAADRVQNLIPPMVQDAKRVALDMANVGAAGTWRESNERMIGAVGDLRHAIQPDLAGQLNSLHVEPPPPPPPIVHHFRHEQELAPLRPPLPAEIFPPPRPPPPAPREEEDEYERMWERYPLRPDDRIMGAAHSLHQAIRQWSSRENDIVAAAKRMAILLAKLSQLVRGEGGSKRDLIDCAKAIADASEEVTRLAMLLARQCTDKRMRSNLLQVCERIPTIATQLKILSTVKATMLGQQAPVSQYDGRPNMGSDEDQEAMELLVLNAQNLMQSVKETVKAAEAASIKIRTDSGVRLLWVRKPMKYEP